MTKTTDAFNSFCDIVKTLNIEQNKNIFSDASDEKYQVVKSTKNAKEHSITWIKYYLNAGNLYFNTYNVFEGKN